VLVRDGLLDVGQPAAVPEWQSEGDPRRAITLDQLLQMTPGLRFAEDYLDDGISDTIKMLFRPGADDMGAFAAALPLDHAPGTVSNYSSGTSNIIARIVRDIIGRDDACAAFLRGEIFDRIGMAHALPKFDRAGTWIGSSYCFATPREFAKFGLLYMRDGTWEGHRVLPEGWVDYGRTPATSQPTDSPRGYGAHWWLLDHDDVGTFFASGYLGQYIFIVPALDVIVVRNGETPAAMRPNVVELARRIIDVFR
jgi:CubicO group peptidase (beta-lactamase class C family)